jgi:hypothetical protein
MFHCVSSASHGMRGDLFVNIVWYLLDDADSDTLDEVGI